MRKFIFSMGFCVLFFERFLDFTFNISLKKKNKIKLLNFNIFKIYLYDEFSYTAIWNTIFYDEYGLNKIIPYFSSRESVIIYNVWVNIWDFILFSKLLFPSARCIGYEIDSNILWIASKNMEINSLEKVSLYNRGITQSQGSFSIIKRDGSGSSSISKMEEWEISCIALKDIQEDEIDILQMDIEWEEFNIFSDEDNLAFLKKVHFFLIEHHDIVKRSLLKEKLLSLGFVLFYQSENNPYTFVFRNTLKS